MPKIKEFCLPQPRYNTIGHRGAGHLAPENSIKGFILAKKLGLTWVEFDTQPCATGEWLIMHDDSLDRTSNGSGLISEYAWAELQQFSIGKEFAVNNLNAAPALHTENPLTKLSDPIPLLSESLEILAKLDLQPNIEIKAPLLQPEKSIDSFLHIIQKHWPSSKALPLISSFDANILLAIKERAPQFPLGLNIEALEKDTIAQFEAGKFFSLHCDYQALTPEKLEALLLQPFPILLYTVNEPALAQHYFQKGIWAVFSDKPNFIAQSLHRD